MNNELLIFLKAFAERLFDFAGNHYVARAIAGAIAHGVDAVLKARKPNG